MGRSTSAQSGECTGVIAKSRTVFSHRCDIVAEIALDLAQADMPNTIYIVQKVFEYAGGSNTLVLPMPAATTAGNYLLVIAASLYNGASFSVTGNGNTFGNILTLPTTADS